jgi:hypothetical protein
MALGDYRPSTTQKRGLPRSSLLFAEKVTVLADAPLDHVEIQPDPQIADPLGRVGLYLSRYVNGDFQGPELRKRSGVGL